MPATDVPFEVVVRLGALAAAACVGLLAVPGLRGRLGWLAIFSAFVLLRPTALGGPTTFTFVSGSSMEPTMRTGDLAVLVRQPTYRVGDVVAYPPSQASEGLIIHRIVGGDAESGYLLRGDNRSTDDFDRPAPGELLGRTLVVLPSVGWFFAGLRVPVLLGFFVALIAMWIAWDFLPEPKKEEALT